MVELVEGMSAKELDFPSFVEACYPTPFGIELNSRWLDDRLKRGSSAESVGESGF